MRQRRGRVGPARKPWGFLIYIAGDNDLSDNGLEDIQELCEEGASPRVHVGVEIDTYGEHTGSIRYEITEPDWMGAAHRTVIQRLGEKDSGDPDTLRSFLEWGLGRYPAGRRVVVVWNHGSGFRTPRRDIASDDFGSSLDMPEVEEAFRRAGIGPRKKIAVLGFDACLMSMLEIAHHFRDQVEILVGSQQVEPGDGWPYDKVLRALKTVSGPVPLAKAIVRAYIKDYRDRGEFDVTQSAIATAKTEPAIRALSDLGDLLGRSLPGQKRTIQAIRLSLQEFEMADYVDLIHFATLVSRGIDLAPVRKAARALAGATRACILHSARLGSGVANAHGLSAWFPGSQGLYYNHRSKYLRLKFASRYRGWVTFLDAYHA